MFDSVVLGHTPSNIVPCLSPVKVRVNGEDKYVPCGHCAKCRSTKLNIQKSLTDRLFQMFPLCLFVTLTYDEDSVPKFTFLPDGSVDFINRKIVKSSPLISFVDEDSRLLSSELKSIYYIWNDSERNYRTKDYVRYINFHDCQILIKRLKRYVATNYPSTQFTYVGCSEYGERYLRPHFHLLLFVSEASVLYGLIRFFNRKIEKKNYGPRPKCWQYGHVKCEVVRDGNVSSYVSSYVSSNLSTPQIFQRREFRGKFFHAQNALALSFKDFIQKVGEAPVADIVDEVLCDSVSDSERLRKWSDFNKLFRRFPNALFLSEYGFTSFFAASERIFDNYLDSGLPLSKFCRVFCHRIVGNYMSGEYSAFWSYYLDSLDVRKLVAHEKLCFNDEVNDEWSRFFGRVYTHLLTYRHYYDCIGPDYNLISWYYTKFDAIAESYKIRSQYSKLSQLDSPELVSAYFSYFENGDLSVFDDSDLMFSYYANLMARKDKSKRLNEPTFFNN